MELIYGYIDDYRGFIKEREFRFSNNFDVKFDKNKKELKIIEKENKSIENFFSKDIINISLIVGKNGVGKTTLIDLLGLKRYDRNTFFKDCFYFFIYRIEKNRYLIEGNEPNLKIINSLFKIKPEDNNLKETFSFKFTIEKEKEIESLVFSEYPNWDEKRTRYGLIYLNIRDRYNEKYGDKREDYSHLFDRYYSINTGFKEKVDYIYKFCESEIFYNRDIEFWIKSSRSNTYLKIHKEKRKYTNKEFYIRDFLSHYLNYFINVNIYNNNSEIQDERNKKFIELLKSVESEKIDFNEYIKDLYDNENKSDVIDKLIESIDINKQGIEFEECKDCLFKLIEKTTKMSIKIGTLKEELANTIKKYVIDYIKLIENIDEKYFKKEGLMINIKKGMELKKILIELFKFIDNIKNNNDYNWWYEQFLKGKIEFKKLSEGEMVYLDLFTKIKESLNINEMKFKETAIILLDEPDKSFHPEWSRRFIYTLIEELENIKKAEKINKLKFQIIVSTHSPFMMSDLPKENIIFMQREDLSKEDNENKINYKEYIKTFGNNIHTLLNDKFFLDSTFGEFAKQKIANCLKDLNSEDYVNEIREKEINYIINSIGEPFLKSELERLRDLKFNKEKELKIKEILEKKHDELEASDIEFMKSQLKNNIR